MIFCLVVVAILISAIICFNKFKNIEPMVGAEKRWTCLRRNTILYKNHQTTKNYLLQFTIFPFSKQLNTYENSIYRYGDIICIVSIKNATN